MDDNKDKLEFFSDIRDKLFLILGGIISLATVIPAFLNSTSKIFGWEHISIGYDVFVAIYFIFPYVFYLLYCSIHDDVGYLELLPSAALDALRQQRGLKTAIELALPLLVLVYLALPGRVFDVGVSVIFCGFSLFCFAWFLKVYYAAGAIRTEFLIVGTIIILVFGLFFGNIIHRECKNGGKLFAYTMGKQDSAFRAYEAMDGLGDNLAGLADSIRKVSAQYRAQAALFHPALSVAPAKLPDCKDCCFNDLAEPFYYLDTTRSLNKETIASQASLIRAGAAEVFAHERHILSAKDTSGLKEVWVIDNFCAHLSDYGFYIRHAKVLVISEKWAVLMKVLQYKSLAWFFFLILLGLCMWLKMHARLQAITNSSSGQVPRLKDNISQVKSLIFLLFILIIPWFRSIDAKDVDLDKPFLNLTLSGLANGTLNPGTDQTSTAPRTGKPDSLTIIHVNRDTLQPGGRDKILKEIDSNVRVSQKLIKDQAKRTIGSATDRNIFNDKRHK